MSNNLKITSYLCLLATFTFMSCEQSSINSPTPEKNSPEVIESTKGNLNSVLDQRDIDLGSIESMQDVNEKFAEEGLNVRLAYAETVTKVDGEQKATGQTIFAEDRQKRLDAQWVPGDERRLADGNNLTYTVWELFAPANFGTADQFDGTPSIDASFDTWNNIKKNAKLNIVKRPNTSDNPSAILGGDPFQADISEIGFMPPLYFELFVGPGSSSNVLGVAFTFLFVDNDGNPTDINNDGYADIALKEVWYNDAFLWTDSGNSSNAVDVETVALHENGHALGFGHFGKVFITNNNNKLHVAPRAVMNAVILGTQRDLLGNEKSSYNSVYGNWPK